MKFQITVVGKPKTFIVEADCKEVAEDTARFEYLAMLEKDMELRVLSYY